MAHLACTPCHRIGRDDRPAVYRWWIRGRYFVNLCDDCAGVWLAGGFEDEKLWPTEVELVAA